MDIKNELGISIDKIDELEDFFKNVSPSISVVKNNANPLFAQIRQLTEDLDREIPAPIKQAVDTAWVANANELSSNDSDKSQRLDLLKKFYYKKNNYSEDELTQLITYSDNKSKSDILLAETTDLRIKMVNEVVRVMGDSPYLNIYQGDNGLSLIEINYDEINDISEENKDLLKKLEGLVLKEHDSRSSSFTTQEDRDVSTSISEIRTKLADSNILNRFESVMTFNKASKEHTVLNNLWTLENLIKDNVSLFEKNQEKHNLKTDDAISEKMFGLDINGELVYFGNCQDIDVAEEKAIQSKKEIVFFIDEDSAKSWRDNLPDLSQKNLCLGISDHLNLYGLGNPESMQDADVLLEDKLGRDGGELYAWISDLDGKQVKQWIKVLEMSLYTKPKKEITATVGIGSGDDDTDDAYGAINEENIVSNSVSGVVNEMQEFVFYNDVDNSTYLDGEIMVDDKYLTTINWSLLKFKENFKAEGQNRVANTGDNAKAIEFLSNIFTENGSASDNMKNATSIYIACYEDAYCLESLSAVFRHGAKGISVNEKIAFDLTALAAYFGDVTAAYNVTKQLKRGRTVSDELTQLLTTLGDIDDFNNWIADKSSIQVRAVEKTMAKISPISNLK